MNTENLVSEIYIRADMNANIAAGHMMRCLSIADAAREQGTKTVFLTADEIPKQLLETRGYEVIVLHSDWEKKEEELDSLLAVIRERGIRKLLIDSYQVTECYLKTLEQYTEVFYLDDLDAFPYPVSHVICYANYYSQLSYAAYPFKTQFHLGTSYMPVRKVYQNCGTKKIRERIERILVLSGGSDPYHILENIVETFDGEAGIEMDVICGAFYADFEGLQKKYSSRDKLHFYQNVSNLENYMEQADLAFSAGGTTLYELCAMGTPAISYAFADNQLRNVQQFARDGIIAYAGDVRYEDVYKNLYQWYQKYKMPEERQVRSRKMQKILDGKGAARIASLLTEEK